MACDANTLMAEAAANGYYGLSDLDLKRALLQLLCSGGSGSGSGAGSIQAFAGTGTPIDGSANPNPGTPTAKVALWFQTDSDPPNQTSALWINGSWQ